MEWQDFCVGASVCVHAYIGCVCVCVMKKSE